MIIQLIFKLFFSLFEGLLNLFPVVDFSIPTDILTNGAFIFNGLGYFIPVGGILPILIINFSLAIFKLTMSIIVRIKSFIPTMGS